nr:MAG TPA: hypothetical protein [Caudoviricetes sp.]
MFNTKSNSASFVVQMIYYTFVFVNELREPVCNKATSD